MWLELILAGLQWMLKNVRAGGRKSMETTLKAWGDSELVAMFTLGYGLKSIGPALASGVPATLEQIKRGAWDDVPKEIFIGQAAQAKVWLDESTHEGWFVAIHITGGSEIVEAFEGKDKDNPLPSPALPAGRFPDHG